MLNRKLQLVLQAQPRRISAMLPKSASMSSSATLRTDSAALMELVRGEGVALRLEPNG
jgi:hypothetical protein